MKFRGIGKVKYCYNIYFDQWAEKDVITFIHRDGGTAKYEFLDMLDIVGYNYVDRWHERRELFFSIDRHDNPGWKMVGTESVSNGGLRGVYSFGKDTYRTVPAADNLIKYKISGAGKLLGLDNGDPADHEPYNTGQRKVFNGLGLALIQAGRLPGKIFLTASSEGMKDTSIEITVTK